MLPLLGMALGGGALGALSNPKDRKKGALMGLGLGLLGPAAGAAMGAGAPVAAATTPLASGLAGPVATAPVGLLGKMKIFLILIVFYLYLLLDKGQLFGKNEKVFPS